MMGCCQSIACIRDSEFLLAPWSSSVQEKQPWAEGLQHVRASFLSFFFHFQISNYFFRFVLKFCFFFFQQNQGLRAMASNHSRMTLKGNITAPVGSEVKRDSGNLLLVLNVIQEHSSVRQLSCTGTITPCTGSCAPVINLQDQPVRLCNWQWKLRWW